MDDKYSLGKAIRYQRGQRTRTEIAKLAGITSTALAEYERGKRKPRVDTLEKVAHALGVSVEELFELESDVRSGKLKLDTEEDVFRHRIRDMELDRIADPKGRGIWEHFALACDHFRSAVLEFLTLWTERNPESKKARDA